MGGTLYMYPSQNNASHNTDLFDGNNGQTAKNVLTGKRYGSVYLTTMPAGVMTSQGLA